MRKYLYKYGVLFFILLSVKFGQAQSQDSLVKVEWHGYSQLRTTTDFDIYNNFSLRRLKLWMQSSDGFNKYWGFKIQGTFAGIRKEAFLLQDVFTTYKIKQFKFWFGQFTPAYSLERFEFDYLLAPVERAKAIDVLIPNGELGARDIGIQAQIKFLNRIDIYGGIFNGYGIKNYRFDNFGYLLTNKISLSLPVGKQKLTAGYSVALRQGTNIVFPKVLSDTVIFSGRDFRYNVFFRFQASKLQLQAEYLTAHLEHYFSEGYYFLARAKIFPKVNLFAGYDYYITTINNLGESIYFGGINYYFDNHKKMLTLDSRFQKNNGKLQNVTVLQLQLFFH
ncbi:MAG: hypothetical protein J7L46_06050 [Bacteroidales bacterium]|nr:hypothetical protein [Bacteroidales bacterium]